ncbi:MAG: MATE family efflux transporter [Lachnospiraceae bacterium]|uniref:MATE family efflux transporter n=1 Tax=Parablautia sp. Marseille-Q6255 TaxID=3039593 RepID=UPI0024BCF6FD|nr:MATE family efflux transporter [Parablautia sp. Marseille-Q6255]
MANSIAKNFRFFSLLRFAFPTMIMMLFMSLYTIVDGIFISRLVGSHALSSTNIVYPVINLIIACGVMLSTGGSALVAKKLGEGRESEAREDFSALLITGILAGVGLMVVGLVFLEPLVRLLGATDLLLDDSMTYLRIALFFAPACILQLFFQTFFVTAGKPGYGLALICAGGVFNIVFDYIFMGPLEMGIAGAAIATGMGQMIPAVAGLLYFTFVRRHLYIVSPVLHKGTLFLSCSNGSSEMVTNISNAVITFLFNSIMLQLLGEPGVAAITIVLYGQFLFNALYMGFSMGVGPVISYNYGCKNLPLLRRVVRICLTFITVSSAVITAVALIASPAIVGIFTPASTETYEIAKTGFFLFSFNYLFAGLNIFSSAMFTSLNNGPVSAAISFMRTFCFIVVNILVLPKLIGVTGVWLAVPVAEFMTLFLSLYMIKTRWKRYFTAS